LYVTDILFMAGADKAHPRSGRNKFRQGVNGVRVGIFSEKERQVDTPKSLAVYSMQIYIISGRGLGLR